ncbi:TIGR02556 family CRISPR-associated protein [Clostridium sp. DL1XJH146]
MQEAIIQIGKSILKEEGMLSSLIQDVQIKDKKENCKYILKFKFYTKENKVKIDLNEELSQASTKKYLFIGSAAGANSPQWYATAKNIWYHLSETIPNLCSHNFGDELNAKLQIVRDEFFVDLGEQYKSTKNRYILDYKKAAISDITIEEIYRETIEEMNEIKDKKQREKKIKDELKKKFLKTLDEYIKINDLKKDSIGLSTIYIDDELICDIEEYKEEVLKEKNSVDKNKKKNSNSKIQNCSICGETNNLSYDMANTQFKFFTTNQVIFGRNISKDYSKNMLLCSNCFAELLAGENYIKNNLNTRLANFTVLIVPHFIINEGLPKEELDDISEQIKMKFNTVKSYEDIDELRDNIISNIEENELEDKVYFLLNFIFYKQNQKSTKVQRLIKDVNPSIFDTIAFGISYANDICVKILGYENKYNLSLAKVYRMVPIRENKKREATQFRDILHLYDSILSQKKISKQFVISNLIHCAKIQFYEQVGFNVSNGKIHNTIMSGNLFIKFLEYINCLEKGEAMDISTLNLKDDLKNYIDTMGYSEEETALFLLGYLVGQVGNAQGKRSEERKKPILNKLNFGGIDKSKMIRLTSDIFNKLKQEKILRYNEGVFAETKRLIDANLNNWKLNKHENLFYILSGYSYSTTKLFGKKKEGGNENE